MGRAKSGFGGRCGGVHVPKSHSWGGKMWETAASCLGAGGSALSKGMSDGTEV